MSKKIQLSPSGIPLVDLAWGGLYRGGTYFLVAPRKSGKTLLALQFAMECAQQKEVCLFFTSMRPKDLMIHASSIDFDLQHFMNQNLVIVVRVSPPANLDEYENPDEYLAEYLKDIVSVVDQYKPNKVVFDELTQLVGFSDPQFLKETFLETIENVEDSGITSLLILSEPATPASQIIVDTLTENATGIITLQKEGESVSILQPGSMSISPNIGHTEGKFTAPYYIEAYKGIMVDFKQASKTTARLQVVDQSLERYKPLAEIELPAEEFVPSNIYSLDDFKLILNNQIAMYHTTGQVFSLVSIRLDESAQRQKLLTLNQLLNTVRLSVDRKDKICSVGNKILVLLSKGDKKAVNNFIVRIKANLPDDDPEYLQSISHLISLFAVKVSKEIQNADDMFALILPGRSTLKEKSTKDLI
ncbi:circadian clock protein kinase KaiC [bacterium BMS3Abin03]|nr:circadian clock protein kinase KaiC [bacterium BMS3Abin03]